MSTPFGHEGGQPSPSQKKTEKTRDFEEKNSIRNMVEIALTP